MQDPSLEGLHDVSDASSDSTEYTSQQKLAVAVGVAAIGAYIGYSLVQSYRIETPQALWAAATKTTSPAAPQIAFVNLHDDLQPLARESVHAWLDLETEVRLTFPTVMFVEEEETSSFADVAGDVRRATVFAHAELQDQRRTRPASSAAPPSSSSPSPSPLCTVVYRSVVEVEGHALEDWDVVAPALRRWHGKPFVQRHCVGFTVDGHTVTVLLQDVEGVLLTTKTMASTSPVKSALHDGAALLRECGAPSTTTFESWWPPSVSRAAPSTVAMMSVNAAQREEKAEALKAFVRTGRPTSLWRGPFALFALLGTVLRYNRPDAAVFPMLLSRQAAPTAALGGWSSRLRSLLPPYRGEEDGAYDERRRLLSAPFLLLVKAAEGSAVPSSEAMKEVQACTVRWVRHFATVAPKHEASMAEVHREKNGQWGLRVDLTRVESTVVEAQWLLTHLAALLVALGVSLDSARLVAVPETPSKASLLYPTPELGDSPHYWKPRKPSAAAGGTGASVSVNAKLAGTSPAAQDPGWIAVELRAEKRSGFIVAQHDFTSL